MKLKREDLLKTLVAARPGLARKAIIESTNHFVFNNGKLITYNDKLAIIHPFDSKLKISVPAEEFYKIISDIDAKKISLKQKKNNILIKAKNTVAKIAGAVDESIADLVKQSGIEEVKEWHSIPKDFVSGSFLCMFSASKDMTSLPLTCVKYNKQYLYSTDEHRVSMYKLKKAINDVFLLPATSVMEITKYDIKKYSNGDGWVYFKTADDIVICARKIDGSYPLLKKYFKVESKTSIDLPKELSNAVQAVTIMTDAEFDIDRTIKVTLKENKILLKAKKEIGYIKKTVPVRYNKSKGEIAFEINPIFLKEVLKVTGEVTIGEDCLLFSSGNFKHIIAI